MSSMRVALIAAILETPEDDTPRLIAADWFEEQGGEANTARAEFIRTQIQRSRLPPDDIRQSELQARELRLLKRWAPVWCGSHFVFKKVRFRRGFIEYVHLHLQHFLHHRREMLALEPVRDISLTGWFRAPDDLIHRVAGCEEWKYIETLRIHHQGLHKSPRSNLVSLLESPHLTRLRALHCSRVQFDWDARQRFERLAILRQLAELSLPILDPFPEYPGEWFSEGGAVFATQWGKLKALSLPYAPEFDLLRQLTKMPFWKRLTSLDLSLTWGISQKLDLLQDQLPESLRELRLSAQGIPVDLSSSFIERLAQIPIESLHLAIPFRAVSLDRLLDQTSRCHLKELSLSACDLTEGHVRAIAESPRVKSLCSLNLNGNWHFGEAAARMLFSSEHLRSLTHLNLDGTRLGAEGAQALASAPGWERLRALKLPDIPLTKNGTRRLLASPNLSQIVWLSLGGDYRKGSSSLTITPASAAEMSRLPNLACLYLNVSTCDERMRRMFSSIDPQSWVWLFSDGLGNDDKTFRAFWAPEQWPPVDDTWELLFRERR